MSETQSGSHTRIANRSAAHPQQQVRLGSVQHTAGNIARPARHHGISGKGTNRRRRPPTSQEQRRKLSAAQKAYVASDPRWAAHRQKLADAQIVRRMTLSPEEFAAVLHMRSKGRTFSYIQEEIGVCHDVIRRELAERGYPTARVRRERRAKRGKGFWRSFDCI